MYWYIYLQKKMTEKYQSRMSPVVFNTEDIEDQTIENNNNYTNNKYNNVMSKCEACKKEKYDPKTTTDDNTNKSHKSCTIESNTICTTHPHKYKDDYCNCTTLNSDNIQSSKNTSNTDTYGMGNLGL